MSNITEAEQSRPFCRHGLEHALDTARVMYIICLEQQLQIPMDVIYAVGMLHDIGRAIQYRTGEAHETAGTETITQILVECSYSNSEIAEILDAIAGHNTQNNGCSNYALGNLICLADHIVRPCFMCRMRTACYWSESEKNTYLRY